MFASFFLTAILQVPAPPVPQEEPPEEITPAPFFEGDIPSTGLADARMTAFDQAMRDFLREGEIPGATLAISKDNRLIYSRGFGYSDFEAQTPMQPDALMRVASLSKPVTATMVFLLEQEGKLKFKDPILRRLDPKLHRGQPPADSRWASITLLQLLQHRAGFDRKLSGDPAFYAQGLGRELGLKTPADKTEVISAMLQRPLDFNPGERYAYSNLGYSLLGRAIESVTGLNYEDAVKQKLLTPLGIDRMYVGRTLRSEAREGEVVYYSSERVKSLVPGQRGKLVPAPYGAWIQPDLDAFGGWIASAPDILKLARIYDPTYASGPLSSKSIDKMFEHPKGKVPEANAPPWYGCGWEVRFYGNGRYNAWHTGSLPGSATLWVMRADGLSWVVLFNSRADNEDNYLSATIDPRLHKAASETQAWPEFDLFEKVPGTAPEDPIRTK